MSRKTLSRLSSQQGAGDPLVSVVIPVFNGARTVSATLRSALSQTCASLEVIVVDDGSTDESCEIVSAFAARDPRVRLVRQANAGVAAARNTGIAQARGDFVAPLDADDLWHPRKLERQVDAAQRAGPAVGLVYCGFRFIDDADRVIETAPYYDVRGWGFLRHLAYNFVGSGSAPLIRRTALERVGGYDPSLRELGAQGCEDYLLQARIARDFPLTGTPEYLVGYRLGDQRMSSGVQRMLESRILAYELLKRETPDLPDRPLLASQAFFEIRNGVRMAESKQARAGFQRIVGGVRRAGLAHMVDLACLTAGWGLSAAGRRLLRRIGEEQRPPFGDLDPADTAGAIGDPFLAAYLRSLAREDAQRGAARTGPGSRTPFASGSGTHGRGEPAPGPTGP